MTILKLSTSLKILVAIIVLILIDRETLLSEQIGKVTESKVGQAPQGEQATSSTIKLQDKVWYGKIDSSETKHFELDLLFPDEGKFFMEIMALAYDRELEVWKTLCEYFFSVTTKKGEEGKVEKSSTRPNGTPYKFKAEGPVISSWDKTAKWDSLKEKTADEKPRSIPIPKPSWRLRQSMDAGEAPLESAVSFVPNPKINEPTKLLLSVSSTVPRDSIVVEFLIPTSIKVIK